jgi:hypothetical protein
LPLLGACGGEDEKAVRDDAPHEPHVMARLTFEEILYVDPGASTWKQIERVREAKKSMLPALEKADVTLPVRKQVEIDLPSLRKERVTVVDATSGTKRAALRLRYQFSAGALVPQSLATKGSLRLGMLHAVDRAHAEAVIVACTAGGERERAPGADLASFFDPTLPSCQDAIAAEDSAIAAARAKLEHPDKEILAVELTRSYLPVTVQIEAHRAPPKMAAMAAAPLAPALPAAPAAEGPAPLPASPAAGTPPLEAPMAQHRVALIGDVAPAADPYAAPAQPQAFAPQPYVPAAAPAPPPDEADVLANQLLAVKSVDQDLAADEAELAQKDHNAAVSAGLAPPPITESASDGVAAPASAFGSGPTPSYLAPNFAMLYAALGVGGLILFGKRRSRR